MKIAIVGSEKKYWAYDQEEQARSFIYSILSNDDTTALVSGHCPRGGVDIWAEEIAESLQIKQIIFPPKTNNWKGYRERNLQIAKECDILFDLEPYGRRSGGYHTLKYALALDKLVTLKEF